MGERSTHFFYNNYAKIERGHPSDLCSGENKWCLKLMRNNSQEFNDISFTFEKINVPVTPKFNYIIGQSSTDMRWLVYDLENENTIINTDEYNKALNAWAEHGNRTLVFIDGRNTRELLTETPESIKSRWAMDLQLWLLFTAAPLIFISVFFWALSNRSKKHYQEKNLKRYRYYQYFFLLPLCLFIYLFISSLIHIILNNW
ncbi:MAG: hypothetical protein DHS20C09_22050 [marine bacterium B5-7]|nr:MAG: hypothetical protein DHS20C09_22050 [marine bacterium B5-7]